MKADADRTKRTGTGSRLKILPATTGFTLVELVIVIAVIAILAALLIPAIAGQVERARTTHAMSDVAELARAVARLRVDTTVSTTGCVDVIANLTALSSPVGCQQASGPFSGPLANCATANPGTPCWGGPYIPAPPIDPWGNSYYATLNTSSFLVVIGSGGGDGSDSSSNAGDDITAAQ